MLYHAHVLNNAIKYALNNSSADSVLVQVSEVFTSLKKIVKDSKSLGWNS